MGCRHSGKQCRVISMLCLTLPFFLAKIVIAYITNSLTLIGDSYHMLSYVITLCVKLFYIQSAKSQTQNNTFGWIRSEVLGGFINGLFLFGLYFTVSLEAVHRLHSGEVIEQPNLLLIVGGAALFIDIIALFIFVCEAHFRSKSSNANDTPKESEEAVQLKNNSMKKFDRGVADLLRSDLFQHILKDVVSSIFVIVSAIVIKHDNCHWRYKFDSAMSLILVIIISVCSMSSMKKNALILLQAVPQHIHIDNIKNKLIREVEGVVSVHELHIWQLTCNCIIASAHIRCKNLKNYMIIAEKVKTFFHNEGIHSTTIQPEFIESEGIKNNGRDCCLECGPDCFPYTCCAIKAIETETASETDQLELQNLSNTSIEYHLNC